MKLENVSDLSKLFKSNFLIKFSICCSVILTFIIYINILVILFIIFIYEMSINFLLQAVRIIHVGNYTDTEITTIYDFLRNLDNITLNSYFNSHQVLQYQNDLEFCVEVIDAMIKIFEDKEEYENCQILLNIKKDAQSIMLININEYEHT